MTPRTTRTLLVLVLAATLIATWFAPEEAGNDVELSTRATATPAAAIERRPPRETNRRLRDEAVEVLPIHPRGEVGEEGALLFAPMSWAPPRVESAPVEAIAAPVVEPVETPTAPPLPFLVLGRYMDRGRSFVFLQYMDQNLAVAVGDTIADAYRVEKLEGNTLMLRYLPLNELQTLEVGGIQ
ncbi:MAG: hypothetical protein LBS49_05795 [Candidatus Accumulibacter sp.]|jgi:hypothetical protein|nr:hypothetical protein [Accumulibacter sp.]